MLEGHDQRQQPRHLEMEVTSRTGLATHLVRTVLVVLVEPYWAMVHTVVAVHKVKP